MLSRVDRIQLAVPDRAEAARGWVDLLDAVHDRDDEVGVLGAHRSTYRLGRSEVEFLEPADPDGAIANALRSRNGRGHLFAAGLATGDLDKLVAHLREQGIEPLLEGDQAHLCADRLPVVLTRDRPTEPVGLVDLLYEVTDLRGDAEAWTARYAELFGLDSAVFCPISSDTYGYAGTLTLLDDDRLDRLEVIHPHDRTKTMGRFFDRAGESLYMAFAESGELPEIRRRCEASGAPHTADQEHTVFMHPQALGGAMLGISARTRAWIWSGHPERVQA
jgi:hypothetical protein